MTLAGLVLAAGAGTRFGQPKALVSFGGETLVARAVHMLSAAGCSPVVSVLGASADEVRQTVDLGHVVVNPDWRTGMGSSLRCGLAALAALPPADVGGEVGGEVGGVVGGVVIALADQPLISSEAVLRLAAAWHAGAAAAVATYGGQPRNPVLLSHAVWSAVSADLDGDRGAGPWLRAHPELVTLVACDNAGSPYDIDTPADLLALDNPEE